MSEKIDISNIDLIVKYLNSNLKGIQNLVKLDGITLEITYIEPISKKQTDELKSICKKIKLQPISIEQNKEYNTKLALQFPEYESQFNEEELKDLYMKNFKWSIDTLYANDINHEVTDEVVRNSRDLVINQCITLYYRSFINPYKHNIDEYLNDENLKHNLILHFFHIIY